MYVYTAQRYAGAVYAVVVCPSVSLSVCLSDTCRHFGVAKRKIMQTTTYDSPWTLVF